MQHLSPLTHDACLLPPLVAMAHPVCVNVTKTHCANHQSGESAGDKNKTGVRHSSKSGQQSPQTLAMRMLLAASSGSPGMRTRLPGAARVWRNRVIQLSISSLNSVPGRNAEACQQPKKCPMPLPTRCHAHKESIAKVTEGGARGRHPTRCTPKPK